ncbi:MAG: hypothetical protein ABW252_07420 [Polyangiales bacterium]
MSAATWLASALPVVLLVGGCRETRCEDLEPVPVSGDYRGGGSLGGERLLNVSLTAKGKDVELRYTSREGSKIRAKYKVTKKLKMKP